MVWVLVLHYDLISMMLQGFRLAIVCPDKCSVATVFSQQSSILGIKHAWQLTIDLASSLDLCHQLNDMMHVHVRRSTLDRFLLATTRLQLNFAVDQQPKVKIGGCHILYQ